MAVEMEMVVVMVLCWGGTSPTWLVKQQPSVSVCVTMQWSLSAIVRHLQIIRIRAQTENIAVSDESLNVLAAIGVKSTLR